MDRLDQKREISDSTKLKEAYDEVYDNNTAEVGLARLLYTGSQAFANLWHWSEFWK